MKVIIAAILLGTVMHAFAKECVLMPAADNFNAEKYFSIPRAYVIYSKNGPRENLCREYQTTKQSDGTIVTTVFGNSGATQPVLTCTYPRGSGNNGQFTAQCEVPGANGVNTQVQVKTSVLATDNQKYVILQRCSNVQDDIVVLQVNKEPLEQGVEDYFDTRGWTFSQWVSRQNAGCNDQ